MDILGIGGWELVAILIIMLVVAGPKRMIAWSYTLGKYVSMLRRMWAETASMLQKEFDDAGVDVKVPTKPVTRGSLNREITKAFTDATKDVTKPIRETMDQVKAEVDHVKSEVDEVKQEMEPAQQNAAMPRTLGKPVTRPPMNEPPPPVEAQNGYTPESPEEKTDFGTWGGST